MTQAKHDLRVMGFRAEVANLHLRGFAPTLETPTAEHQLHIPFFSE